MPHAFCSTYGTCAHPLLGDGSPRLALHPQLAPRRVRRGSGTAVPQGPGCGSAPRGYGFRLHTTHPARCSLRIFPRSEPRSILFLSGEEEGGWGICGASGARVSSRETSPGTALLEPPALGAAQHQVTPDMLCTATTPHTRLAEGLLALNTSTSC